ncbi:MAG: FAD-dependent oxidoreductase [Myxococcota bacterium]|nr:FAD-dependent oxidoreductase [Myxococcota bacterium]
MKILIIGAGLSGLAAAWRLHQAGHVVEVVERRDPAAPDCDFPPVQTLHSSDRYTLKWIGELGISDSLLPLRPVQLVQARRDRAYAIEPQRLLGVAAISGVTRRDSLRLMRWSRLMTRYLPLLDPTAPELAASLDYRSVSDFAGLYFGKSALDYWVAPEVEDFFSGEANQLSRVTALLLWRARMMDPQGITFTGLPRMGMDHLFSAARGLLPKRYHAAASGIEGSGKQGYSLTCEGAAPDSLHADAVVLATSPGEANRLAPSLLQPAERDYLGAVRERPSVTLTAELERVPGGMPERVRLPRGEGFSAGSIVFEPGLPGTRAGSGAGLATIQGRESFAVDARQVPDDAVIKSLLADLKLLYPALSGNVAKLHLARSEASIPAFDVGAYRGLERFRRVQADRRALGRRLYFAGDYLVAPGVEGSVVSGFRAAADLIADAAEGASEDRG